MIMVNIDLIPNALALIVFIGTVLFVTVYASFSNWRATPPGRALMYWAASFAALILMNTIHLYTGRYPGIEFVRITVYAALAFSVWRLVWVLIHILRGGDRLDVNQVIQRKEKK